MTTGTITTAKSAMPSSTPTLAIKRTAKSQQPPTKSCSSSSAMQPRRRPTKFAASSIIALASLLAVTLLLLTGTPEGAEARILPEPMTANGLKQSGGWRTWHQQQPQSSHEESAEADAEEAESLPQRGKEKRRLVVRVPFAQNPDGLQLSRIYKSLFEPSNSRAKKQPWTYSLRHFVQQQGNDEAN